MEIFETFSNFFLILERDNQTSLRTQQTNPKGVGERTASNSSKVSLDNQNNKRLLYVKSVFRPNTSFLPFLLRLNNTLFQRGHLNGAVSHPKTSFLPFSIRLHNTMQKQGHLNSAVSRKNTILLR